MKGALKEIKINITALNSAVVQNIQSNYFSPLWLTEFVRQYSACDGEGEYSSFSYMTFGSHETGVAKKIIKEIGKFNLSFDVIYETIIHEVEVHGPIFDPADHVDAEKL